ncbi:arginine deiminase family protein [Chloroflexota bacterium]
MTFTLAITRKPGPDFSEGITTATLGPPSYELILEQHQAYLNTLQTMGLEVIVLEALPGYPDAYFVEDTAVITPEIAVLTIPGAAARRGEAAAIEAAIRQQRQIAYIQAPGTVDGGDVLQVGSHFFIGISERTNQEGARQLGAILAQHGNTWTGVPLSAGLHLKSSVNYAGKDTLLITNDFAKMDLFKGYKKIVLDADEAYAANTLLINDHLLTPSGFPATRRKLDSLGLEIIEMDVSEVQKMDGGLTCMSLRF